jgi:hypothetical protein
MKDILYVQKLLGRKSIQYTLIYVDCEEAALGLGRDEEFTVRVATSVQEACETVETDFEYVTGECNDGGKNFRKLK